ncbi:MAG: lipid-A-disaccharide synthase [Chthoniobacterales bacterium]
MTGDMSGDVYTSRLAYRAAMISPGIEMHAVGGGNLGAAVECAGGTWVADSTAYSKIGIYSSIPHLLKGKLFQKQLCSYISSHRIDLAVLCDWGAANCRQLSFLKKKGIPVLYYFPPGSWRRKGRLGSDVVRYATRIATPFSWSAERFKKENCQAEWVGHPALESFSGDCKRADLRLEFGVNDEEHLVALFPGSRVSEIRALAPRLAAASRLIRNRVRVKFVVPVPGAAMMDVVRPYFPEALCVVGRTRDVLTAGDVAVVKTGTATLEAAVSGTPQVAVYDFGWIGRLEWLLLWMWKKIPFVAMPNIILQRKAVPELLGLACTPEAIATEVLSLLENREKREKMRLDYREIRKLLGEQLPYGATDRTVNIILEMLGENALKQPCEG